MAVSCIMARCDEAIGAGILEWTIALPWPNHLGQFQATDGTAEAATNVRQSETDIADVFKKRPSVSL
jgi:hypothetical protein